MPKRPPRFCASHGCGILTHDGYCDTHRAEVQRRRKERETWRDYGPRWRAARAQVLKLEPLCRFCGEQATVVDHVLSLQAGGTHDLANLRPLCKRCHDARTYRDTLGRQRNDTEQG